MMNNWKTNFSAPGRVVGLKLTESAENLHGRDSVAFPAVEISPQSPSKMFLPVRADSFRADETKWSGRKMAALTVNALALAG
jgi:hypothetical protein